jgi:hypothetical protein
LVGLPSGDVDLEDFFSCSHRSFWQRRRISFFIFAFFWLDLIVIPSGCSVRTTRSLKLFLARLDCYPEWVLGENDQVAKIVFGLT